MAVPHALKARVDPVPPSSTDPLVAAWNELRRRLCAPIARKISQTTHTGDNIVYKEQSEPHSSPPLTPYEIKNLPPLTGLSVMNDYPVRVFEKATLELTLRDLAGEHTAPIVLRPLPDPQPTEVNVDTILLSYSSERELVGKIQYLLDLRAGYLLSVIVGKYTCFWQPVDTFSAADLSGGLGTAEPPCTLIEIKLSSVLGDNDFESIAAAIEAGHVDWYMPELVYDAPKDASATEVKPKEKLSQAKWGAFRDGVKLNQAEWPEKADSILYQMYAQLVAAKEVSGHLDQVQLDRTCGLLTNGRKWLVMSEKDGVAYVSPFVLDSEEHAVAAVLTALVLGAMTPSAKHGAGASDHAYEGDDEPAAKRQKGERRILRALADEVVPGPKVTFVEPATPPPRTPSPPPLPVETVRHAQVLTFRFQDLWKREKFSQDFWHRATSPQLSRRVHYRHEADPLSAPTVKEPPELTFRLWSRFRPDTLVFVYRSMDLRYILKHVECILLGDLDGFAAAEELFCEAVVLEHLERVAPSLAGVLFPHFLGLWTPVGDRALCGLMTAWFGEPIEHHSLEYLQSLDPMGALDQLHSLGVAHGDIHRSNLRLVSTSPSTEPSSPPLTSSATDRSPPSRRHKFAFLDFGRSRLEKDLTSEQWESAKAGDRRALRRTLTPNGLVL
ncbi:hypothetical protein Rhopal_007096-T1 [Rhodotorula paludigena]|uniref:Protein kinase domain-containing protein n=1 Tax=Rhodotorula paludigena TaxID=86838 RepID=A0AAV5GUU6_9BASI|nr:hypothetical protein Rhopal_007096-T1 [Rhodotorula paludigena]